MTSQRGMAWRAGIGAAAIAALGGCASEDPLFLVEAALFAPTLKGDVGLSNTVTNDVDTIDVDSDLDLGDTEYVPGLRGEVDLGPFNLAADWFATQQDGTGFVTADFGDITAGSTVDTSFDLSLAHASFVFDLLDTDLVKLGLGLAADYVDLEIEAREPAFGLNESIDVQQVIPLVAAHGAVRLDPLVVAPIRLDLRAAAISLDFDDIDGTFVDAEAMLRFESGILGLFAGYRYILIQADGESDGQSFDGDITLAGWMAGLSVRF